MRAVIVGAGVGGLATAVALERAGIEARVYERRHDAAGVEAGTGLTMWPNAMVSLGKLGLREQIEANGSPLLWLEQRTSGWRELRRFNLGEIAQRSGIPIVNVTRAHLTTVLRSALSDDTVVLGHNCTGFTQTQDLAIAPVANAPPGQTDTPGRVRDELGERFRGWPEPVGAMIVATEETAILRTDIHDRPPVPGWGEARVTLLGDAAHAMTFNVGQGACQAIDGAVIMAGELRETANVEAGLRAYEIQRIERTSGLIERAWRQGKILQWHNPIACAFRDRFFVRLVGGGGFLA